MPLTDAQIEAQIGQALELARHAEQRAYVLASQMDAWLRLGAHPGADDPMAGASTELTEWCRSVRDLLALMAGE